VVIGTVVIGPAVIANLLIDPITRLAWPARLTQNIQKMTENVFDDRLSFF
jgi:hypothetical protein